MEILHVFGIKWQLIAIQMLNFALLLYVLKRFAFTPLMRIIEERQRIVAKGVEDAKAAEIAKEKTEKDRGDIILNARREAEHMILEIKQHADQEARESLRAAQEKGSSILIEAKRRGEEMHAELLKESEKEIARLAVLGMEKLLQKQQ